MEAEYIYCDHCGLEDFHIHIAYVRTTASGDIYRCPNCDKEIWNVVEETEENDE